jgi:hypothetical protein
MAAVSSVKDLRRATSGKVVREPLPKALTSLFRVLDGSAPVDTVELHIGGAREVDTGTAEE